MKKLIIVMMSFFLLAGCSTVKDNSKINVTVTTTMIADLVRVIGGDRVEVYGMMKEGVDPHSYKARPSDVLAIDNADIVAYNGVHLEAKLVDIFDSLNEQGKTLLKLEEGMDSSRFISVGNETFDPHIWFDVGLWKQSAIYTAKVLGEYEPESKAYFNDNLDKYLIELDELDQYIVDSLSEIPESSRTLVTAHDAFMYFGQAYNVEVVAVQGINSQSEAGIKDINNLANRVVQDNIKSVYSESSVPIKTIEALVAAVKNQGHDLEIGGELYSDSLKENTSYIDTFKENIDTITQGLR